MYVLASFVEELLVEAKVGLANRERSVWAGGRSAKRKLSGARRCERLFKQDEIQSYLYGSSEEEYLGKKLRDYSHAP